MDGLIEHVKYEVRQKDTRHPGKPFINKEFDRIAEWCTIL